MNIKVNKFGSTVGILAVAIGSTVVVANLSTLILQAQGQTSPAIKIDGSSTVYPITQAIAKQFQADLFQTQSR